MMIEKKSKIYEMFESFIITATFLVVLLPVRVIWFEFISKDWIGSVGIISVITVLLVVLSKKNKLGWWGKMFNRQMWKIHHGKRKWIVYTNVIVFSFVFGLSAYSIEMGNTIYLEQKKQFEELLPSTDLTDITQAMKDADISFEEYLDAFAGLILLPFYRFDIFAVLLATTNDSTNGFIQHFSFVFFIEQLEIIGVLIFTRWQSKKGMTKNEVL